MERVVENLGIVTIDGRSVPARKGQSLFDCGEEAGIRIPTSCKKNGKCRECLVEIVGGEDALEPRTPEEARLNEGYRLACRARLRSNSEEISCRSLQRGSFRIEECATDLPRPLASVAIEPAVSRKNDRVLIDGRVIAEREGPLLGIAIDLGTTTIAFRVIDLSTKEILHGGSFENPQRFAGSDVMARIAYDSDTPGRVLQRSLIGSLNRSIAALPIDSKDVYEMVVAGNSTMREIFFGRSVESIGQKPYRSITENEWRSGMRDSTTLEAKGSSLRLDIHPEARVYSLPLIGSHIGADTAACLLAISMEKEGQRIALMDIGTNTEVICGNAQKAMAASCPAGPAFEGGSISCGMPGLDGAIERIRIAEDGKVSYSTIGDATPEGICGSGLIDALSELLRTGGIDEYGRFSNEDPMGYIDRERNIYIHESDISELAQAKGANVAGIQILLKRYGISFDDIDVFYLAGGFARHLDVEAAKRIGLLPDLPSDRIKRIGNAALEGASIALVSTTLRKEIEEFVKGIEHVELERDPRFFDHFVDGCLYKPYKNCGFEAAL